jgi:uncharacterized protein involved in type VI secretion and phage assembly
MANTPKTRSTAAELLADWRAAGRDAVAARAAAKIAAMALEAASSAEEAAAEVETAARAALMAVESARALAAKARHAASEAALAAAAMLEQAGGDKVRANHDVDIADQAEKEAAEAFHSAETEGFPK